MRRFLPQHIFNYLHVENLKTSVVQLTYANSDMSMLILLPDDNDGLAALESNLKSINFDEIQKQMTENIVTVSLPRFQIHFSINLKKTLKKVRICYVYLV